MSCQLSSQVLALKWRPRSFQDVVGQDSTLRILNNALTQQRLHHAYLFTGTRGVGKTSLARILAKCLNCVSGITANPCEECSACLAINAGKFLDLYEIDAASRTKVEDTRELLEGVIYPPTQGRYKIYIIDEVHMLSTHSFNALLKTLEEPPSHVIFLLATTDPKRIPITILSRCLQFHLKHIDPQQIASRLQHICTAEIIPAEREALDKLAKAATGSMRDALSLLDQAIAYGNSTVKLNDVQAMLGSVAQDNLMPLLQALAKQDASLVFAHCHKLAEHAPDFGQILEEMITLFQRIAILQLLPETALAEEGALSALGRQFSAEDVQLYYQIALLARHDLALSPTPQQGFEMTLVRMLAFHPHLASPSVSPPHSSREEAKAEKVQKIGQEVEKKERQQPSLPPQEWRDLLPKLELTGMAYALASNCSLVALQETQVQLSLSIHHQPMLHQKLTQRIEEALSHYFKKPMKLEVHLTTDELATPQKQQQKDHEQQLGAAKQAILGDERVKKLLAMYDATVEVSLYP